MSSVLTLYSLVSEVSVSLLDSFTSSIRPMAMSKTRWAVVLGAGIVFPPLEKGEALGLPFVSFYQAVAVEDT